MANQTYNDVILGAIKTIEDRQTRSGYKYYYEPTAYGTFQPITDKDLVKQRLNDLKALIKSE